jgi:uncharacterized OB-fold protein
VIKPIPKPEGLNAEFYEHCARHELRFQRCECGVWRHPPRVLCAACGSEEWTWALASGRGRVFTWTVTHQALHPAYADDVPYAVLVVEMDEGVRMVSTLRDLDPGDLALDLPVEVVFEARPDATRPDAITLPCFRPSTRR